jgi:hypothetical protein
MMQSCFSVCDSLDLFQTKTHIRFFAPVAVVLRRRSPVRFEIGAATVDPQARSLQNRSPFAFVSI